MTVEDGARGDAPLGQRQAEKAIPAPPERRSPAQLRWRYKGRREWTPAVYREVYEFAKAQCSREEIAAWLGWSEAGLERQLKRHGWKGFDEFQRGAVNSARAQVRARLCRMALSGKHPGVTLFLAKSLLGMGDRRPGSTGLDELLAMDDAAVGARIAQLRADGVEIPEAAEPPKRRGGHPRQPPAIPAPENYGYEGE